MDRISNDILRLILEKDRKNFINVGSVARRFKQCYTFNQSQDTDIRVMRNMIVDAIDRDDMDSFLYVCGTSFLYYISWKYKYKEMYEDIIIEIVSKNRFLMYKNFYKVFHDDLLSENMNHLLTDRIQTSIVTHKRLDMLSHSLSHITYTRMSHRYKDTLMCSILRSINDVDIFEFIYKKHFEKQPSESEIIQHILTTSSIEILDYLYSNYTDIVTSTFSLTRYRIDPIIDASRNNNIDILQWAHEKQLIQLRGSKFMIVKEAILRGHKSVIMWYKDTYGFIEMGELWSFLTKHVVHSMMDFSHSIVPVDVNDHTLYLNVLRNFSVFREDKCIQCLHWLEDHKVQITAEVNEYASTMNNVYVSSFFDV